MIKVSVKYGGLGQRVACERVCRSQGGEALSGHTSRTADLVCKGRYVV